MAEVYTIKEYAIRVAKCHTNTVRSRIKNGNLPSNHFIKKGGKENMIIVSSIHEYKAGEYFDACCEYQRIKENHIGKEDKLAAELSVKYDILLTKLCKILGI